MENRARGGGLRGAAPASARCRQPHLGRAGVCRESFASGEHAATDRLLLHLARDAKHALSNADNYTLTLPPELNGTQPSNYTAGHPMTENFWSWARGYVFAKIEAVADLDGDGQFSDKLTYHIGADELFTTTTIDQPIVIQKDNPIQLTFELDLEQVLQRQGDFLDISEVANTQDHTNNPDIYEWLWDNLTNNLSLKN